MVNMIVELAIPFQNVLRSILAWKMDLCLSPKEPMKEACVHLCKWAILLKRAGFQMVLYLRSMNREAG